MRLIDADELKTKKRYSTEFHENVVAVAEIDWMPTIDAVPVVRCGECKHWDKWVCDKDGGHECIYNGGVWMEDEFCSDGERKDGEQK